MAADREQRVFVRWGGRRNRADDVAKALGARLIALKWGTKRPWLVPVRYAVQMLQTFALLLRCRASVVISQHTQPFGSLASLAYARLASAALVLDCHNGPVVGSLSNRWPLRGLHRGIIRRAHLVLFHNEAVLQTARERGFDGAFTVLRDCLPDAVPVEAAEPPYVVAVCSFASDEPIDLLFAAFGELADVDFRVTGDDRRLDPALRRDLPANVVLTGFLSNADYDAMVGQAAAVVALSTYDDVLMRAHHEALAAGVPLITTDQAIIRAYLEEAAVYVRHDQDALREAVVEALANRRQLRHRVQAVAARRRAEWDLQRGRVDATIRTLAGGGRTGSDRGN